MNILACVLSLCFAASWSIAALDGEAGTACLGVAASVLTFPYFLVRFGERIAQNTLIAFLLLIIGIIFPALWPLTAIWALVCLIGKFARLLANLPLILAGVLVYLATAFLPTELMDIMRSNFAQAPSELLVLLVGVIGGLVFWLLVGLAVAFGSTIDRSSALMLGFGAYLLLFALTFLLPHADGGDV